MAIVLTIILFCYFYCGLKIYIGKNFPAIRNVSDNVYTKLIQFNHFYAVENSILSFIFSLWTIAISIGYTIIPFSNSCLIGFRLSVGTSQII